jgi:CelD/BcsL family acetyltransferase involved in cellulose biosynthesis
MTVTGDTSTLLDVDPRHDPRWAALVSGPAGSVFTSPPWLRAITATYEEFVPEAVIVCDDAGTPVSGAASVPVSDALGCRRLGLPFSDYADLVIGDEAHRGVLLSALLADGAQARLRVLHNDLVDVDPRLTVTHEAGWHTIAVDDDEDELWARLGGSSRRNIRKARENGVEIEVHDDLDAVRRFYDLHVGVRIGKYGLLPQPREFFDAIHAEFAALDAVRVVMARHDGADVAGILVLVWGDVAYYKFNASSPAALALRPNDLLMWHSMLLASELGCRSLDLGISELSQDGLVRYKRKFATTEARVTTYATERSSTPEADQLRSTFTDLTRLLADPDLPAHIAPEAGRLLYRYFA